MHQRQHRFAGGVSEIEPVLLSLFFEPVICGGIEGHVDFSVSDAGFGARFHCGDKL